MPPKAPLKLGKKVRIPHNLFTKPIAEGKVGRQEEESHR